MEGNGVEVVIGVEKHLEVLVDEWMEGCKVEEAGGEESLVGNTSSSASRVGAGADWGRDSIIGSVVQLWKRTLWPAAVSNAVGAGWVEGAG